MYSSISLGKASQTTPQGCCHKCAEAGFELTIKQLTALCLDHLDIFWGACSLEVLFLDI
jgi:hypothetical protein